MNAVQWNVFADNKYLTYFIKIELDLFLFQDIQNCIKQSFHLKIPKQLSLDFVDIWF